MFEMATTSVCDWLLYTRAVWPSSHNVWQLFHVERQECGEGATIGYEISLNHSNGSLSDFFALHARHEQHKLPTASEPPRERGMM